MTVDLTETYGYHAYSSLFCGGEYAHRPHRWFDEKFEVDHDCSGWSARMNEFGETPSIYVWPARHAEGTAYPHDFWEKLRYALSLAGIEFERV